MFTASSTASRLIGFSCFKRHIAHLTRSASIPGCQPEHGKMMTLGLYFLLLHGATIFHIDWHRCGYNLHSSEILLRGEQSRRKLNCCNGPVQRNTMKCFALNCTPAPSFEKMRKHFHRYNGIGALRGSDLQEWSTSSDISCRIIWRHWTQ